MNESEMMSTTPAMVFEAISERESFMGFMPAGGHQSDHQKANASSSSGGLSSNQGDIRFALESEINFNMDMESPFRETFAGLPPPPLFSSSVQSQNQPVRPYEESNLKDLEKLARSEVSETTAQNSPPSKTANDDIATVSPPPSTVASASPARPDKITTPTRTNQPKPSANRSRDVSPPRALSESPDFTLPRSQQTANIPAVSIQQQRSQVAAPSSTSSMLTSPVDEFPTRKPNRKDKKEAPAAAMVPSLTPKTGNPFAPASSKPSLNDAQNTPVFSNYNSVPNAPDNYQVSGNPAANLVPVKASAAPIIGSALSANKDSPQIGVGSLLSAAIPAVYPNPPSIGNTSSVSTPGATSASAAGSALGGAVPMRKTAGRPAAAAASSGLGGPGPVSATKPGMASASSTGGPGVIGGGVGSAARNRKSAGADKISIPTLDVSSSSTAFSNHTLRDIMNDVPGGEGVAQPGFTMSTGATQRSMFPHTQQPPVSGNSSSKNLAKVQEDGAEDDARRSSPAFSTNGGQPPAAVRLTINGNATPYSSQPQLTPTVTSFNDACQWLTSVSVAPVNFKLISEELLQVNLRYIRGLLNSKDNFRKFSTADRCDVVTKIFKRYCTVSAVVTEECMGLIVALCKPSDQDIDIDGTNEENVKLFGLNGCLTDLVPAINKYGKPQSVGSSTQSKNSAAVSGSIVTSQLANTMIAIAKYGCIIIRQLSTNVHHNASLGREGVCECLVDLLFHHISHDEVISEGLMAIMNLAYNADNAQKLCNTSATALPTTNACKLVPLALLRHSSDPLIAQWGCLSIVNLSADDVLNRLQLGRSGACDVLLQLLYIHSSTTPPVADKATNNGASESPENSSTGTGTLASAAVSQYICLAMGTLAQSPENRPLLMSTSSISAFVRVIECHSSNIPVLENLLTTIANIANDSPENQSKFGKLPDLFKHLVRLLKTNTSQAGIIEKALVAIQRLIVNHFINRNLFVENEVYEAVADIAKAHHKDLVIVSAACKLLNTLNDLATDPSVVTVSASVPVPIKPNSLTFYQRPNELLVTLCNVMQFYSASSSGAVVNSGEIAVLMEQVYKLVRFIAFVRNEEYSKLFVPTIDINVDGLSELATGQLLVRTMERHMGDERVVTAACDAIAEVAGVSSARSILGQSKACYVIIQALNSHSNNTLVVPTALRAIASLAEKHRDNCVLFGVEGACEVIIASMKRHIGNGDVIRQGSNAIAQMALQDDTNLHQLINAGVCELLVQAVFVNLTDAVICSRLLRTICAICMEGDDPQGSELTNAGSASPKAQPSVNKLKLNDARACSAIVALLHCHCTRSDAHSVELLPWIFRVIGSLSTVDALRSKFGASTVCSLIVKTFHQSGNVLNNEISHAGFVAVGNIAYDPDFASILGQLGACEALVQSMKVHFADASVTEQCLWALKNLSVLDVNQVRFS